MQTTLTKLSGSQQDKKVEWRCDGKKGSVEVGGMRAVERGHENDQFSCMKLLKKKTKDKTQQIPAKYKENCRLKSHEYADIPVIIP